MEVRGRERGRSDRSEVRTGELPQTVCDVMVEGGKLDYLRKVRKRQATMHMADHS